MYIYFIINANKCVHICVHTLFFNILEYKLSFSCTIHEPILIYATPDV